jgi:hypothetical protein
MGKVYDKNLLAVARKAALYDEMIEAVICVCGDFRHMGERYDDRTGFYGLKNWNASSKESAPKGHCLPTSKRG